MLRGAIIALLALVLGASSVLAQDGDRSGSGDWRFQLTPYLWALHVDGKVRPDSDGLPSANVDQSFKDILNDLNGAFFLSGSARLDRFVVLGDFNWSSLSKSGEATIPPVGSTRLKGRMKHMSGTLTAGYTAFRESNLSWDIVGGLRAWNVKVQADAPELGITEEKTVRWVDPVVGTRARIELAPDWSLTAYGDVGGFGLGADLTWQLWGTVNYEISEDIFLSGGYRHLYVDYKSGGGTRVDTHIGGPIFGVTFRF